MTTDAAPVRADLGDELDPADYSTGWSTLSSLGSALVTLLFIVAAAIGDAVNFESALGVVMEDLPQYLLVFAVAALTSAAVGLMHFAGKSHKGFRCGMGRRGSAIALTFIWFLLGVGLLLLRVVGYKWYLATLASDAFGTATAAGPATRWQELAHYALALLFFVLYLATGAMASWAAYRAHEPVQDAARRAARLRRRAEERAAKRRRLEEERAAEQERLEQERTAEQERLEQERLAEQERAEQERLAAQERQEKEREAEQHRLEQECEADRRRLEQEREEQRRREEAHAAELRRQAEDAVHQLELELIDLDARLERERNEIPRDKERQEAASKAIDAWSDELRAHARQRMSLVVGTPWGTSALTCDDQ